MAVPGVRPNFAGKYKSVLRLTRVMERSSHNPFPKKSLAVLFPLIDGPVSLRRAEDAGSGGDGVRDSSPPFPP